MIAEQDLVSDGNTRWCGHAKSSVRCRRFAGQLDIATGAVRAQQHMDAGTTGERR
jgi:hypothetical protein